MVTRTRPQTSNVSFVVNESKGLRDAHNRASALLKKYVGANDAERTSILRELAIALVDARGEFHREDGSPDWKGRSYAYRVFVRELYDGVAFNKEQQNTIQAAVRYHIGQVLRDRLDDETLEAYDLLAKSPRERGAEQRAGRSALLQTLQGRESAGGALLGLTGVSMVLQRIQGSDLSSLAANERELARVTLADLERRVRALRKALG